MAAHAGSLPTPRLFWRRRFLGGLGLCLRILRLRAEGHGLDAERQDADAARALICQVSRG